MSASKKARVSSPAEEEKKEFWDTYGRDRCDSLASSLKKATNKTGYRHVYQVSKTYRGSYSFYSNVYDIKAGKLEYIRVACPHGLRDGGDLCAYSALSKTKALQDQRDATLLSGCLMT